jgi:hypothetical protein
MSDTPTNYLPYDGEKCNVCDKTSTRIVIFEDAHMALCRTCNGKDIYEGEVH